jgi:hypothetical protein
VARSKSTSIPHSGFLRNIQILGGERKERQKLDAFLGRKGGTSALDLIYVG